MNEEAWIERSLTRQGINIVGEITPVQERPWSAVSLVPTDAGSVYFKAVDAASDFEPALTQALYQRRPDAVPQVLAVDSARGWMLQRDGGRTLRQAFRAGLNLQFWKYVLIPYAGLQNDLAADVGELLALGARDRRLALLPALYEELVQGTDWLMIGERDGLTAAEHERLVEAIPQVEAMCRQLTAYAVPESLHHNDLHDANVFYDAGRLLFFDWGDSSISHPFFSLRTVFVSVENSFGLAEDDPQFDDLAWAYLRPWARFATKENLWAAYQIARRLWALSSAVKYKTQLQLIEGMRKDYATAVPGLLQEFLAANLQFK